MISAEKKKEKKEGEDEEEGGAVIMKARERVGGEEMLMVDDRSRPLPLECRDSASPVSLVLVLSVRSPQCNVQVQR